MNFQNFKLPSNRKFGFFFTFIFTLTASYFYNTENIMCAYAFTLVALMFLVVTLINSDILLPLNKLWMRFGLLLGMIVSPIILGLIFFGLFTPIAILMRVSGRDEIKLKFAEKASHWISRSEPVNSASFKKQF
jgi:hypothetical protein